MAESQEMKRLQIASGLFMLAVTGIMGIAFVSRPDTAQVIIVTPLDSGDVTYTPDFGTPAAIQCELPCVINVYGYVDIEGTAILLAELGAFGSPLTPTPLATTPLIATPTPVWQGPTLTPTIEKVIGRYCFTGTTSQNIRSGPDSNNAVIGRLFPQQCLEVLTVNTFPNGDMWFKTPRGWVAYRIGIRQFGNYVQIVN